MASATVKALPTQLEEQGYQTGRRQRSQKSTSVHIGCIPPQSAPAILLIALPGASGAVASPPVQPDVIQHCGGTDSPLVNAPD